MKYQFIINPITNRKCRVDSALGKRIIKGYAQTGGVADCEPSYSWGGPNWVQHNNSGWGTTCRRKDDGTNWYDEEADWAGEDYSTGLLMTPRDRDESVKSGDMDDLSEDYGERKDRLEEEEAEAERRLKRAEKAAAEGARTERRLKRAEKAAAMAAKAEKAAAKEAKAQRRLKRAEKQRLRDKLSTKQVQKLK